MDSLYIFKESFVQRLRISIKSNIRNYTIDDGWVNNLGTSSERELRTSITINSLPELVIPSSSENLHDIEMLFLCIRYFQN